MLRQFLLLLLAGPLLGASAPPSPRLTGPGADTVALERVALRVAVAGPIARVEQTLTFVNRIDRVQEGMLETPLPEDATLSDYALDIDGVLVDAVPVPKERARIVFEEEVRRGVDPGLAEKIAGNVYRIRIYPIPPRGRRTVRVAYLTALPANRPLTVPLRFGAPVPHVRIAVTGSSATLGGHALPATVRTFASLGETDLVVKRAGTASTLPAVDMLRGQGRFFALVMPPAPARQVRRAALRALRIVWDASLSRRTSARQKELDTLERLVARHPQARVDVQTLRDTLSPPRNFPASPDRPAALRAFLAAQPVDGGTDLGGLALPPFDGVYVLITDGHDTLGRGAPTSAGAPVLALCADPRANRPYLRHLATTSGGAFADLATLSIDDGLATLLGPAPRLPRIVASPARAVADLRVSPDGTLLCGRLRAPSATLAIDGRTVPLSAAGATATGIVGRYWAQRQAAFLELSPDQNRAALAALSRDFGIVTGETSLLVLENLEQHVRYRIPPPRSRPALYDAYLGRVARETKAQTRKDRTHLSALIAAWNDEVTWWRQTHQPDKSKQKQRFLRGARPAQARSEDTGLSLNSGMVTVRRRASGAGMASANVGRAYSFGGGSGTMMGSASRRAPAFALSVTTSAMRASTVEMPESGGGEVSVRAWQPAAPYLVELRKLAPEATYAGYLARREPYADVPAYYLDCAELLLQRGRLAEGVRVLTGLADLELEDIALLRIVARRLQQLGQLDRAIPLFERIRTLRPDEPQSLRDLALALADQGQVVRAVHWLNEVVMRTWNRGEDDFQGIEMVALKEANRIARRLPAGARNPIDQRLRGVLDADLRVVLTWDTDQTDMDLHVVEPGGEECFYSNNRTASGGRLSNDFTNGYGPEEYQIRRARPGRYQVKAHFYGSRSQRGPAPTTLQATLFTHYGRPSERRRTLTLRLGENERTYVVGDVRLP